MEELIFRQLELVRNDTLKLLESISEQEADQMPPGFNNTIRWHLGHILSAHERLAFVLNGAPFGLPESFRDKFGNGTKPADWGDWQPPTLEELKSMLQEQVNRIKQGTAGKLQEKLKTPFRDFSVAAEALNFATYHEGVHNGFIRALKRAVAAQA